MVIWAYFDPCIYPMLINYISIQIFFIHKCTHQEVIVGPLYFFAHVSLCTSLVDIMTLLQKKSSKFGTTLFGYLNSKFKVNYL